MFVFVRIAHIARGPNFSRTKDASAEHIKKRIKGGEYLAGNIEISRKGKMSVKSREDVRGTRMKEEEILEECIEESSLATGRMIFMIIYLLSFFGSLILFVHHAKFCATK